VKVESCAQWDVPVISRSHMMGDGHRVVLECPTETGVHGVISGELDARAKEVDAGVGIKRGVEGSRASADAQVGSREKAARR